MDDELDDWDEDADAMCVNPECGWFGEPYDALFGVCPECESEVEIQGGEP